MTRRESIEATIYALLFMMDKAKEDAKGGQWGGGYSPGAADSDQGIRGRIEEGRIKWL